MSCGLIPITTDDASMKYILKDGQNGLRASKYNPEDLSKKLTKILEMSNDNLQLLSKNARETIVNDFDLERFILKLESLYESIRK
jgi:glycosyltransferase involved in cell wall biosynthesis